MYTGNACLLDNPSKITFLYLSLCKHFVILLNLCIYRLTNILILIRFLYIICDTVHDNTYVRYTHQVVLCALLIQLFYFFHSSRDSNLQCLMGDAEHGQTTNTRPRWIFSFSIYFAILASLEYGTIQCEQ